MSEIITLDEEKTKLVMKEREGVGVIFPIYIEFIEILPNFHLYSVDCRAEFEGKDVLNRIDELIGNEFITQKETIRLPTFLNDAVEDADEDSLDNIIPVLEPSYNMNFMTGRREEQSMYFPSYYHKVNWIALIITPYLRDGNFEGDILTHHFKNCTEFMNAYVPDNEEKFATKLQVLRDSMEDAEYGGEFEQYFEIAKIVRKDLYEKYEPIYRGLKQSNIVMGDDIYYAYGDKLRMTPKP